MPFHSPFNFPFFNYKYPRYIPNPAHPGLDRKPLNSTTNIKNNSSTNIASNNIYKNNNLYTNHTSNNINKYNSSSTDKNLDSIYLENSNKSSNYSSRDYNYSNSTHPTDYSDSPDSDIDSEPFFEILGLKLYYDDILIICILFFLYSEGVKDDELFVSLLLLLLT